MPAWPSKCWPRVGDDDAAGLGRLQVHVVESDRVIGDGPDAVGKPSDNVGRHGFGVTGQDGVGAFRPGDDLILGIELVVGVEPGFVVALEALFHGVGQLAGDQDDGFHGAALDRC